MAISALATRSRLGLLGRGMCPDLNVGRYTKHAQHGDELYRCKVFLLTGA